MTNKNIPATRRVHTSADITERTTVLSDVFHAFHNGDGKAVRELLEIYSPHSIDDALCYLPSRVDYRVLAQLTSVELAEFLNDLPTPRQLAYIKPLDNAIVVAALEEMAPDEANDLLRAIDYERRERLQAHMSKAAMQQIDLIAKYEESQLGSLVNPAFVVVDPTTKAQEVANVLRSTSEVRFDTDTIFVCDHDGKLVGAVELVEIVRRMTSNESVNEFMDVDLPDVCAHQSVRDGLNAQQDSRLSLLPVKDEQGRLLGVVSHRDLMEADSRLSASMLTRFGGSLMDSNLDYFASPFRKLFFTRVFWLLLLTVFGVITSTFVASQEEILGQVIILAAFIAPIIDMGGNAGSQSATLVLRSMALGQVKAEWKQLGRIVVREIPVGIAMAATVAIAEIIMAVLSKGDYIFTSGSGLGVLMVVGLSMFVCTILGAIIGSILPFLASKIGADPATLSAPLINSIMDILGVMVYFGFATILLADLL
ncbi:magnesium transporter [Trueperella pyogenes]|uniref:magnesium transporter n=1 Tax=Trueperella pyogenes TaxID=1661 RepID=UPI00324CDC52